LATRAEEPVPYGGFLTRPPLATRAEEPGPYGGFLTRTIAFVIDAAIVNVVAIVVAGAIALGLTVLLPGSHKLHAGGIAIAGAAFVLWCIAYWAVFWTMTGQTPGARVMHLRVVCTDGERLHAFRATVRVLAAAVAAIPLLWGYVPILVTPRRRGFHDWVAGTVVVVRSDVSADGDAAPKRVGRSLRPR
jgi:uncharacterized RDD family membrane protein YckC